MNQGSDFFYYIFPLIITVIAFMGYKKPGNGFLIMIILLFFSMFRGDYVGNDTLNYMDENRISYRGGSLELGYNTIYVTENFGSSTEYLDIFLNRIVFNLDLPSRIVIWTYSFFSIVFFYLALKRFKVNTSIGLLFYVLLGFYYKSFNFARQASALSIFLYGISYLDTNKFRTNLRFIITTLLSSLIHASSIFYLPIFFINRIKLDRNLCTFILTFVCIISVLFPFNVMTLLYKIDLDYISRYIGIYEDNGRSIMGRIFDIPIYTFFVYTFIKGNSKKYTDVKDNLFAFAIILFALFNQVDGLLSRIIYYITIYMCVYISHYFISCKGIYDKTYVFLFVVFLIFNTYGLGKWAVNSLISGYYLMFF